MLHVEDAERLVTHDAQRPWPRAASLAVVTGGRIVLFTLSHFLSRDLEQNTVAAVVTAELKSCARREKVDMQ